MRASKGRPLSIKEGIQYDTVAFWLLNKLSRIKTSWKGLLYTKLFIPYQGGITMDLLKELAGPPLALETIGLR